MPRSSRRIDLILPEELGCREVGIDGEGNIEQGVEFEFRHLKPVLGKPALISSLQRQPFTLSMYERSRVSMRILSPTLTKRGTIIVEPFSIVAGLRVLVAVSPRSPGSE